MTLVCLHEHHFFLKFSLRAHILLYCDLIWHFFLTLWFLNRQQVCNRPLQSYTSCTKGFKRSWWQQTMKLGSCWKSWKHFSLHRWISFASLESFFPSHLWNVFTPLIFIWNSFRNEQPHRISAPASLNVSVLVPDIRLESSHSRIPGWEDGEYGTHEPERTRGGRKRDTKTGDLTSDRTMVVPRCCVMLLLLHAQAWTAGKEGRSSMAVVMGALAPPEWGSCLQKPWAAVTWAALPLTFQFGNLFFFFDWASTCPLRNAAKEAHVNNLQQYTECVLHTKLWLNSPLV